MKKTATYYLLLPVYVVCFYAVFVAVKILTWLHLPKQTKSNNKRVLFLESMGPPSAGYRHRSNGWVNALKENGFDAVTWFVLPYNRQWKLQQTREGMLRLQMIYLLKRFAQCFNTAGFDTVVVRREILLYNDYGNLFFEKWLRQIHHMLILDVDDDISAAKNEPRKISAFGKAMLESPEKFRTSLRFYDHIIVASDYLKQLFLSWDNGLSGSDISVVPTCVDYYKLHHKMYSDSDALKIGWVGSAYNLHNLYSVYPALEELALDHNIELVVVCNAVPKSAGFPVTFIEWSEEKELENLMLADIGIMPLVESDASKGKGGFKLIQYMGCGMVSVATAITINKEIVNDGVNGFLVSHQGDWPRVLRDVIAKRNEFEAIGARAAQTIEQRYSYDAHLQQMVGIVNGLKEENIRRSSSHQAVK